MRDRRGSLSGAGIRLFRIVVAICWTVTWTLPSRADEGVTLNLGVFAFRPPEILQPRYQPLADHLSRQLDGARVRLLVLSQDEMERALTEKRLDLLFTNPSHYVLLRGRNQLTGALATLISMESGQPTDQLGGVIVARASGSPVAGPGQLRDRVIGVPGVKFLGGYQTQAYELLQAGVRLPDDARAMVSLGSHDEVIRAVLDGRVEFGFVRTGVIEEMTREGKLDPDALRIVGERNYPGFPYRLSTHLYPEWPFVALPHVDGRLVRKIASSLMGLEANHPVARASGIGGFSPPKDYLPVENLARALRMPPYDATPEMTPLEVWERWLPLWLGLIAAVTAMLSLATWRLSNRNRALLRLRAEQREAAETLRQSEEKYRELVENANSILLKWNRRGEILFLNEYGQRFFGYQEDEILGKPVVGTIVPGHGDDGRDLAALMTDIFARPERYAQNVNENRRKDGGHVWVSWSNKPIRDASGEVVGMFSVGIDITARVRAERAAARQSEYRQLILELSTAFINLPLDRVDAEVRAALGRIGEFLDADRAYIFAYDFDAGTASNTHEWRAPGVAPRIGDSRDVPIDGLGECVSRHRRGEAFVVADLADLPPGPPRELLQARGIRGLLTLPLIREGHCLGFVGIDAIGAGDDALDLLGLFARLLVNLSARQRSEDQLRQSASVFEHSHEGILITDAEANILDVNTAFTRITGYPREQVLGRNPRLLGSGHHDRGFFAELWRSLLRTGEWSGEIWNRRANGEVYAVMQTISAVRDENGEPRRYVGMFADITPLKEHQRQLEHIAHYDALTDLPNRVLLADRLRQAMTRASRRRSLIAAVYLDLDGFKQVNDHHGHATGDALLVHLAGHMKQALRDGDTLARLGGDEFVAVLIDLESREAAIPVVERLLTAATEPARVGDLELRVSASIGVSFHPRTEGIDADGLLHQADQAMYLAKQAGKNRYRLFEAWPANQE